MTAYSTPTATPGTTPRSIVNGTGVPPPVVTPMAPPPPAVAPAPPVAAATPSVATRAAGQRQAMMGGLGPIYSSPSMIDPGGKQGLANYGGMTGPIADTVHKLDGFQI